MTRSCTTVCVLIALLTVLCSGIPIAAISDFGSVVRVSNAGDDSWDGSSWACPKKTIQAAIDRLGSDGGEVWVQSGVYQTSVTMRSNVSLYGGFHGSEIGLDERNPILNESILDGQNLRPIIIVNKCSNCSINGFTITNGFGKQNGGVIGCFQSQIDITENKIKAWWLG